MKIKFVSSLAVLACVLGQSVALAAPPTLTVGSKAPALDIEHWVQDGDGKFEHVEEFDQGNVYVVEFWATWCGPCIMSMPKLAELQTKYRGQKVQVISVSDESLDTVKALLPKKHPQVEKTFAELTSAYSLTTDPDRSVHKAYMDAANLQGIPSAFVVGKTGLIEWIGHPVEMEGPLEEVIQGTWDREAFKLELQRQQEMEEAQQKIFELANQGDFDGAVKLIEEQIEKFKDSEEIKESLTAMRFDLMLAGGKVTDEVLKFHRDRLAGMKGNIQQLGQFCYFLYNLHQQGSDVGVLAKDAVKMLTGEISDAPPEFKPVLLNLAAQLHSVNKDFEQAIASQEAAMEATEDPRQKQRLKLFLDDLKRSQKEDAGEQKKSDQ